jgi:hypothetical protein
MNSIVTSNGLSARRKTFALKRKLFNPAWGFILVIFTLVFSCKEKSDSGYTNLKDSTALEKDSLFKPKVNIEVNRRFDKKGNVIGFDSTYSTFYSNIRGDTAAMDSAMRRFNTFFQKSNPYFFNNHLNPLFFNDSLQYPDFFHNDFFLRHYQLNDAYMRDMMQRMDSIKNEYYKADSSFSIKSKKSKHT